jgi:hypothetical protein
MDGIRVWASTKFEGLDLLGCAEKHLVKADIHRRMDLLRKETSPYQCNLDALVLRAPNGARRQPPQASLTVAGGLIGDRWSLGKADPGDQVSMMNLDVAHLIANGQSVVLFGDNLFTRLDLSEAALPVGTVLQVGSARLQVSAKPHVPCGQFKARFGEAAFKMAAKNVRIRGIYLTVLASGSVALGDPIKVLA